jgi:fructose-bisphosphate aldolase class I
MFDLVHQMRTRIITSPSFNGDRILGAILFEMTMKRFIEGMGTAEYLWQRKQIVPFLKIDLGLEAVAEGVQLMKPMPNLTHRLEVALGHGVFGTKMRSVIALANPLGIEHVVDQQFEIANQVSEQGLYPIIEPEVDIKSPEKFEAEVLLKQSLLDHLNNLDSSADVLLKLTLPNTDGFYSEFVNHPRVIRVFALSGGYSRSEANEHLSRNPGMLASFSRALTEGLSAQQSEAEFDAALDESIASIYAASVKE